MPTMGTDLWRDGTMTLEFWAWGANYTIVKNRHIGLDQAPDPAGQPWAVPSLVDGRVVASIQTGTLGRVVVVDTGRATRRYISYCHGYYGDPLYLDAAAPQGARVMRLARANERPGSLWRGVHCHVVVHDKMHGAFEVGWNDTYYDPAVEIAAYLGNDSTAGGGSSPFVPKEWDEMASKEEVKAALREVIGEKMVAPTVSIVPLADGKIYLFSALTGRRAHIASPYHVQIIQRALDNNSNDTMLPGELDIVAGYLVAVNPPVGATVDTEALAKRLAELDASDDAATVKTAVREALADTVGEVRFPL